MPLVTLRVHTPGSPEASIDGCTCPDIDNHFGKGIDGGTKLSAAGQPCYYIETTCPVHGDEAQETARFGPWIH